MDKLNIFDFTNYREYLKAYYKHKKGLNKSFSYRSFAHKAGYRSSGLYKDVVSGRTNITPQFTSKLSIAIGHNKREEEYFENMVLFNQAKNPSDKSKYFRRMTRFYNSKAYKVDSKQFEFYSKWYYSAIRELINIGDFDDNYSNIAKSLNPKIRTDQADKAIKLLLKLGLINKDDNGFYKSVDKTITTGDEVNSMNVANFQRSMMDLAKEAIERHSSSIRNISTLTVHISSESYKEIEAEIIALRKRILSIAANDNKDDRVYQINLQLFPLSNIKEDDND